MAAWRAVHLNDSSGTAAEWWSTVASLINFQLSLQYSHSAPQPPTIILPASLLPTTHLHLHPITRRINNTPIKRAPAHWIRTALFAHKSRNKFSSQHVHSFFAGSYIMDETILLMNESFPRLKKNPARQPVCTGGALQMSREIVWRHPLCLSNCRLLLKISIFPLSLQF